MYLKKMDPKYKTVTYNKSNINFPRYPSSIKLNPNKYMSSNSQTIRYINFNNNNFSSESLSANRKPKQKIDLESSNSTNILYQNIIKLLENYIINNSENNVKINEAFFSLYHKTKNFLSSNNFNTNDDEKDKLITFLKISYEEKLEELNKKIEELNNEIEILTNSNKKIYSKDINNKLHFILNNYKKKLNEQEKKYKCAEYKYLICINDLQNKINSLEKKLEEKKAFEDDSVEIKEVKCFPNRTQSDFKYKINPKKIPLFKNLVHKKKLKLNSFKKIKSLDNIGENNLNIDNRKILDKIKLMKSIDDYTPENIINKEKKFFISHPNLIIAGASNKEKVHSFGVPKNINRVKISKYLDKNVFYSYPSTIGEILVNIEKVKNRNFLEKINSS